MMRSRKLLMFRFYAAILIIAFAVLGYAVAAICIDDSQGHALPGLERLPLLVSALTGLLGLSLYLLIICMEKQYERVFSDLSDWVADISIGKFSGGMSLHREGALAKLYKQISTMERSSESMIDSLRNEKAHMKDFIANISHQLRTPLTNLLMYSELLLKNTGDSYTANKAELCLSQIQRMDWLVKTLLKIAKFDSDSIELNYSRANLADTVRHGMQLALTQFRDSAPRVTFTGESDCPMRHDRQWLAEAIENIMVNAIRNLEEDGRVQVNLEVGEAVATVTIEDNGRGISEQDLPHIFERFYTSQSGSKTSGSVGVGLSLVKSIISAHHGTIKAPAVPKGAKFVISLPLIEGRLSYGNVI